MKSLWGKRELTLGEENKGRIEETQAFSRSLPLIREQNYHWKGREELKEGEKVGVRKKRRKEKRKEEGKKGKGRKERGRKESPKVAKERHGCRSMTSYVPSKGSKGSTIKFLLLSFPSLQQTSQNPQRE